jgi:hypothetical protein
MNELESIALEQIIELSKGAFNEVALLPLNFNDKLLPTASKLTKIEHIAQAILDNKK